MGNLFSTVLDMSIRTSIVILAVILVRALMHKAPRKYSYALWVVVAYRMLVPISFSSKLSLFTGIGRLIETVYQKTSTIDTPTEAIAPHFDVRQEITHFVYQIERTTGPFRETVGSPVRMNSGDEAVQEMSARVSALSVISIIWAVGIVFLLTYATLSYIRYSRHIAKSELLRDNIWYSIQISTPIIFGYFKPIILIPPGLDPMTENMVISHERYHLRRCDHLVKLAAYIIACIHWFNPLCWLAYILMSRDQELSCDEYVLSHYQGCEKVYSKALLSFATGRKPVVPTPIHFAEMPAKKRIISALKFRKYGKTISAIALCLCIVTIIGCAANGKGKTIVKSNGDSTVEPNETITDNRIPWVYHTASGSADDVNDYYINSGNSYGLYHLAYGDGFAHITYIDYETKRQTFLCSDSECNHANSTCTALVAAHGTDVIPIATDRELLLIYPSYVERADLDGNNRRLVASLNGQTDTILPGILLSDDGRELALMYSTQTVERNNAGDIISLSRVFTLANIDTETGEKTELRKFEDAFAIICAASNKGIVIRKGTDDGTIESEIILLPYDGSEDITLFDHIGENRDYGFYEDKLFYFVGEDDRSLHMMDLNTLKSSTILDKLTDEFYTTKIAKERIGSLLYFTDYIGEKLFIGSIHEGSDSTGAYGYEYRTICVDLKTKQVSVIELNNRYPTSIYEADATPESWFTLPVEIIGYHGDVLLVDMGKDWSDYVRTIEYALISLDDYISGTANYKKIDMLDNGFVAKPK